MPTDTKRRSQITLNFSARPSPDVSFSGLRFRRFSFNGWYYQYPPRDKDIFDIKALENLARNSEGNDDRSATFAPARGLAACIREDFDGHTDFPLLTSEQRLEWLYQAATFVHDFKGKAQSFLAKAAPPPPSIS